jgi:hypothetical protein
MSGTYIIFENFINENVNYPEPCELWTIKIPSIFIFSVETNIECISCPSSPWLLKNNLGHWRICMDILGLCNYPDFTEELWQELINGTEHAAIERKFRSGYSL